MFREVSRTPHKTAGSQHNLALCTPKDGLHAEQSFAQRGLPKSGTDSHSGASSLGKIRLRRTSITD